jgi:hypothetical protein
LEVEKSVKRRKFYIENLWEDERELEERLIKSLCREELIIIEDLLY